MRQLVVVILLLLGAAAPARAADTLGGLTLSADSAGYRIALGGTVTRARAPVERFADAATHGRYRAESGRNGVVLIDSRTGHRKVLARDAGEGVWWSAQGTLAFDHRVDDIDRLEVLDPATGLRRVVARRLCSIAASPWSPDGTKLAVAVAEAGHGCGGQQLTHASVADLSAHRLRTLGGVGSRPLGWTRDGTRALVAATDGPLQLVDPRSGSATRALPRYVDFGPAEWSADGRFASIDAVDASSRVYLVLIVDGAFRHVIAAFSGQPTAWAPAGARLAVASTDGLQVYDAARERVVTDVSARTDYGLEVSVLAWDAGGRSLRIAALPNPGHD